MSGAATTVRVCPIDGPTLFWLPIGAPVDHRTRSEIKKRDQWRCATCGGAGVLPAWVK